MQGEVNGLGRLSSLKARFKKLTRKKTIEELERERRLLEQEKRRLQLEAQVERAKQEIRKLKGQTGWSAKLRSISQRARELEQAFSPSEIMGFSDFGFGTTARKPPVKKKKRGKRRSKRKRRRSR